MSVSRRDFLATAVAGSLSVGLGDIASGAQDSANPKANAASGKRPIIVCANNGFNYLDAAYAFLAGGGDTLDAALGVVKGPEDDPNDTSVGLGGLPNEEGVVELDACCMHGPTRRAGSVGGVRNIKNVSLVSKAVMDHTGHVMLVGEGAERFAVDMGFPRENLLTDHSRKVWLLWKEYQRKRSRTALETLLAYNIQDTINLETLMVEAYNRKVRETPFAASHLLPSRASLRLPSVPKRRAVDP